MPPATTAAAAEPAVVPKEFKRAASAYTVPPVLAIKATPAAEGKLWLLATILEGTDLSLSVSPIKEEGLEVVLVGAADYAARKLEVPPHPEGYLLEVSPDGILLLARDALGAQWGLLRLRDALDVKAKAIPSFTIRDWPALRWRAVHIFMPVEIELAAFKRFVDEVLVPYRFNTIVLEVNYKFAFQRRPEVAEPDGPGAAFAGEIRDYLSSRGIRAIPQFNCLGHQSWGPRKAALLRSYPDLDETPWIAPDDKQLYCRSWCPRHPNLAPIVYDLWHELIGAFRSEHFHIGMDEVFLIAEKGCPRCAGSSPCETFRAAATQYHAFFRGAGNEVLMWGDRLLDARRFGYSKFEGSETDTWKALADLPRDIIVCDWHYGVREDYPSLKHFTDQGFRVLACPWRDPKNVERLWECAQRLGTDRFLGFLATTWVSFEDLVDALLKGRGSEKGKGAAACLKLVGRLCWEGGRR